MRNVDSGGGHGCVGAEGMLKICVPSSERLHFHFSLSCIGEGNGNLLQRSCLENPGYRGAWWAAVSVVAQSRTRLKQLSSEPKTVLKNFF